MTEQAAVRLPDETCSRLEALSSRTGRTATCCIREAVEAHLDDLEDIYLAEQVIERIRSAQEQVRTLDDVDRKLGLADRVVGHGRQATLEDRPDRGQADDGVPARGWSRGTIPGSSGRP